jgi:hypothetical protein
MAEQTLPEDFKEFLKLLNEAEVRYLLVGGYAVGFHGYPRATADMDIWVAVSADNAARLVEVFHRFGMTDPHVTADCSSKRQNHPHGRAPDAVRGADGNRRR